jgi:hypothetical protein
MTLDVLPLALELHMNSLPQLVVVLLVMAVSLYVMRKRK